jgi:RNA polymerase sigma factor (sigma-70 family)
MAKELLMNPNDRLADDDAGQFRTTHWSVVLLSAQTQVPGSRTALADLCRLYWYPLYAFVRRRGYSAEDAQDLTQGFFLSLLERKSLRQVGPEKGKFRSFLLASLKNYLSDAFDRDNSIKRGGQIEFVAFDFGTGEERYGEEHADFLTAEKIFDARWAITLLDHAIGRLRQEYAAQGKTATIEALQPFLDPGNSKRLPSYEEVAEKLQVSLGGVKTLIHRLRRRYSEISREEVARTVTDPQAIDEEIHALCEALIASEGRLGP